MGFLCIRVYLFILDYALLSETFQHLLALQYALLLLL